MEYSEFIPDRFQEVSGHYKNFIRMLLTDFEGIIRLVAPKFMKKGTHMRQVITIQKKLALTLRFLAKGDMLIRVEHTSRPHTV